MDTFLHEPPGRQRARVAFVGIGNTLAGDDGAGVVALERLANALSNEEKETMLFCRLAGDLYAIGDFLDTAERFVFLDAAIGDASGELRVIRNDASCAHTGSFHQTDIGAVMRALSKLEWCVPFPEWEIRGITIALPDRLCEGLSPEVDRAVDRLVGEVVGEVRGIEQGRSI